MNTCNNYYPKRTVISIYIQSVLMYGFRKAIAFLFGEHINIKGRGFFI